MEANKCQDSTENPFCDPREYLDRKYVETYRLGGGMFAWLLTLCTQDLEFVSTRLREPIPPPKRLAILLHWLAHGFAERQLANLYHVGPSTVNSIIHTTLAVLLRDLVPLAIRFPQGDALRKTMQDFQRISGLPLRAGAIDGTLTRIRKPVVWGVQYGCYKSYPAIVILAVVDANGRYTCIDAGRAG